MYRNKFRARGSNQRPSPRPSTSGGSNQSDGETSRGKGRHPPGLKGREIGMWYAKRSRNQQGKKNKEHCRETNQRPVIAMGHEAELKVTRLLGSFQERTDGYQAGCSNIAQDDGCESWKSPTSFQIRFQNHLAQSSVDYQVKECFDSDVDGLTRLEHLDERYADELNAKQNDPRFQQMLQFRQKLPAYKMRQELIDTVAKNQVVVISGETGCGKTTQVPQFILDSYIEAGKGSVCSVVCTQPRRISAISVAERVAQERVEKCGSSSVGYQIRLESKFPRNCGSILYCTTGIMLKWLERDKWASVSLEPPTSCQPTFPAKGGCFLNCILHNVPKYKTKPVPVLIFLPNPAVAKVQGSVSDLAVFSKPHLMSPLPVLLAMDLNYLSPYPFPPFAVLPMSLWSEVMSAETRSFPRSLSISVHLIIRFLAKLTHIVLDEVHERDVLSDFLLIILKDLLIKRPDLKLVLMSASLNAKQFSKYYGNCAMLTIPGFTFPVKELFLEDALQETNFLIRPSTEQMYGKPKRRREQAALIQKFQYEMGPFIRNLSGRYSPRVIDSLKNMTDEDINLDLITALIQHICRNKPDGAILVFLPGWDQISKVNTLISAQEYFRSGNHIIIPLHSMMPTVNQKEVFNRPPSGIRKIILATNIAETSITIDDVVYVIDCGKIKIKNFDINLNLATLKPEWVSRANALQRKGRAGRVQPGVCYHLYTSYRHELLESYQLPEMLRTRLEELCLQIKLLKLGPIIPLLERAMEPPQLEAVRLSIEFLQTLNALDTDENLTPLGFHLAHLPVDPQTGKMILFGAIFSCLDPITSVAASLGFKDAFVTPLGKEHDVDFRKQVLAANSTSDHILLVNALKGWEKAKRCGTEQRYCWENFLSSHTLQLLANMKDQLVRYLQDLNFVTVSNSKDPGLNRNSSNMKLVKAVVCAGLYPNVAKVKNPRRKKARRNCVTVFTKYDAGVTVHPKSVNSHLGNFESPWLVYHQKMKSTNVFLYDCTMIMPYPLLFFGGNLKVEEEGDQTAIVVDDWIRFWCGRSMAKLFMALRRELDNLLESKITNPGPTDWSKESKEGALLHAIVELLATEEVLTNELLNGKEGAEEDDDEDECMEEP